MTPVVRVVGLGPGGRDHVTVRTRSLLSSSPVVRLRTRHHPCAKEFAHLESYDEWYESAESFEALYDAIVDDLVQLATNSPNLEVLYAVPGSPVVAERTVELLRARREVATWTEPAVSVIDVACAALGRDPMTEGLRVVDALGTSRDFRGPGPLLVLQTYSPEVLASVADRLDGSSRVKVLHHVGLVDELICDLPARELATFSRVDHLTSLWVEGFRDAGVATGDLVTLVKRLRAQCPWDQEQTHASLTRHLLEEAYEALDALEDLVRASEGASEHAREELGDLLFQVLFHAELGDEEGIFNLTTILDALGEKLISRHPHVFANVPVSDSREVAARWEALKRDEKGRDSVTDGIARQLPALATYTKLLAKAVLVGVNIDSGERSRERVTEALGKVHFAAPSLDTQSSSDVDVAWGDALSALVTAAHFAEVDLEGLLRERSNTLRETIRRVEGLPWS